MVTAMNAPTKALKNARIRRPFKGNKAMACGGRTGVQGSIPRSTRAFQSKAHAYCGWRNRHVRSRISDVILQPAKRSRALPVVFN